MNFIQRIFSQPKAESMVAAAMEPKSAEPTESTEITGESRHYPGLQVGKLTDVGQERQQNQDAYYVMDSMVQTEQRQDLFGIFIVADGMGGHQKGEQASALAARVAASSLLKDIYLPFLSNDQSANNRPLNEALIAAVEKANSAVHQQVSDGGTTLTAALIMGNNAYIAHVGDSRAYIFHQDKLKQITHDHSLAQRLEELGQATAAEAKQVQNVLYRAIGQSEALEVDTHMQHLPHGAALLLCSDGLWGLVTDEEIKEVLTTSPDAQAACARLVNLANKNGGRDNITAVVVSVGGFRP